MLQIFQARQSKQECVERCQAAHSTLSNENQEIVGFRCGMSRLQYVARMSSGEPNEEDVLEIIDQRRPQSHPAKYVAFAIVAVVFVICGYLLMLHFTPRAIVGAATAPLEKGAALTERFLSHIAGTLAQSRVTTKTEIEVGRITAMDKVAPLVVAKRELVLRFTNVDEQIFGTSTAEVRAIGQAYYFVPLLGAQAMWKIDSTEKNGIRACIVHAPALRVLTPVNLDTRSLEIRTKTGALRSNQQEMIDAALVDLTARLNQQARLQEPEVRTAARKTIAAFVQNWLLADAKWGQGHFNAIQVIFPGETLGDADFTIPGFYDSK